MTVGAFVCGCSGLWLTEGERAFLARWKPWGLILFKRNIGAPDDVRRLVASFRDVVGREDAPVLVDQEGGRVQRLGPPHWPAYPAAAVFDRLPNSNDAEKANVARLTARLIAADLAAVGIDVDCLPVLDVPASDGHAIIGDRSYSDDPQRVAHLGRATAEGLLAGGVLPVIKHIPGHGRARADSHHELPVVTTDWETLTRVDFVPFRAVSDMPVAMTAHVVYTAVDPAYPATTSKRVLDNVVRGEIGFDGLLLSDDLSMKALSGSMHERAVAARQAGVDIALHCNGDLREAEAVAGGAGVLDGMAERRAHAALARRRTANGTFDLRQARTRLDEALAQVGSTSVAADRIG